MFHGLAGEVVATILPNTEADAVALLVNYLAYFGNVIGRVPFFRVGETDHYTNIYGVLVGETAGMRDVYKMIGRLATIASELALRVFSLISSQNHDMI
jgi:hypothetical protein